MRALVVHESPVGTADLARAVGEGLAETSIVDVVAVRRAPLHVEPVDLLVVATGHQAAEVDRWLRSAELDAVEAVVVLGTRVRRPGARRSTARSTQRRLRRRGLRAAAPATTFVVEDRHGYVVGSELARARRWGRVLAAAMALACRTHRQPAPAAESVLPSAALSA